MIFGFFEARELKNARKEMEKNRTPWTIQNFVKVASDHDKSQEALETVEEALKEFPNSECLQDSYRLLVKQKVQDDIRVYRQQLKDGSDGSAYYKLALKYKECGDYDQSIELARKGTRLFPDFEGNYIILGDIRYERFQRDLRATDGLLAIELLEKAADLNHENYRLLRQLAEIYLAVGAKDMCVEKLNEILNFAPDDSATLKLLGQAHKLKTPKKTGIKEILDEFERRAELHSQLKSKGIGPRGQRYLRQGKQLQALLEQFSTRLEGFQRALVMTPQSKLIAAVPSGSENENYVTSLKPCFEAALDCCLKMDISTYEKGLFETDKGLVYLLTFDRLQMAIFCSSQTKQKKLKDETFRFLEHDLYL